MDDTFRIYVDRLRDGKQLAIHESVEPAFLDVHETSLIFDQPVTIDGLASTAGDNFVLQLSAVTEVKIPCAICNEWVHVKLNVKSFYHSEPITEIKSSIFNFKELIRNAILLEIPLFAECNNGNCTHRQEIAKYLKVPKSKVEKETSEDGYHPFAELNWEEENL